MTSLMDLATDPRQYDKMGNTWLTISDHAPYRKLLLRYVASILDARGKRILEIGSGTGWFSRFIIKNQPISYTGLEPSEASYAYAKSLNPEVDYQLRTLQNFSDRSFDLVVSIFVFNHLPDLQEAFSKISDLLSANGEIAVIIPDFESYRLPRFGYRIDLEPINEDCYAARVWRSSAPTTDLVRKTDRIEKDAAINGLKLFRDIPIIPDDGFLEEEPRYTEIRTRPIARLLVFKK